MQRVGMAATARQAPQFLLGVLSAMTPLARCVVASPGPSLARRVGALSRGESRSASRAPFFGSNQVGHSQPARIAVPLEPGNALETRNMLIEDFDTRATEQ
jgi:hypothetical protein